MNKLPYNIQLIRDELKKLPYNIPLIRDELKKGDDYHYTKLLECVDGSTAYLEHQRAMGTLFTIGVLLDELEIEVEAGDPKAMRLLASGHVYGEYGLDKDEVKAQYWRDKLKEIEND